MSLFGALFSGVSGLQSQSSAMGAIADNVTNVNTIGYKGTKVNFKTLITAQVSLTQYSPGGVQSAPKQQVDLQGLLQATTSSTDLGISGSGFFVTNEAPSPAEGDLYTFTRAGSFKVDKEGFLQNVGGAYMQGWPLSFYDGTPSANKVTVGTNVYMKAYVNDAGDRVLINDNVIDDQNLRPLNLQTIGGTASPTTTLSVGANIACRSFGQRPRAREHADLRQLGQPTQHDLRLHKNHAKYVAYEHGAAGAVGGYFAKNAKRRSALLGWPHRLQRRIHCADHGPDRHCAAGCRNIIHD